MNRSLTASFAAFALAIALAACGGSETPQPEATTTLPTAEMAEQAAEARLEDGVQVVDITVGPEGYTPKSISLQAGVPARLVFTRTVEGECASQVQIPSFDVPVTDLPMHEPTALTFTPDSSGTFQFVCGMDMLSGTLVVRS